VRYRAFISYSHADAVAAAWLHRKLEGWRVPARMRAENPALPDKLAPVFRDREELGSAGELGPQIQAALADSDALIVLCSPEAARSRWVDTEVRAFRDGARGERVFALIVGGEPHAGDERECFPASLRESEPLAADLRPGKDGRELALLKLIAGLLHVPLDALRQREARRRHQRMLAITSLALLVTIITSFLAVQAVIARQAAERRQKQAEALVGFMLGDLNDKLSEVSRLDILEGVHDHAMDYFQSLPEADVTPEVLEQRAQALMRIGNVRQEQGHYDKALQSYLAADKLAVALAAQAPGNLRVQKLHAELLAFVGIMHWYQGDVDQAQAGFDGARKVLVAAQAHAPGDTDLLFQLSSLENNAGNVLEARGRLEDATSCYRRMLALTQLLAKTAPAFVDGQTQLGLAYNNLARMDFMQGDLPGAVAGYGSDMKVQEGIAAANPRNNAQAERVVISRGTYGRILALSGGLDEGAASLQSALDGAVRLHELEPSSASFHEDVALYGTQLARLRRLQGELPAAQAASARSLAAFAALRKQDATQAGWQRGEAEARLESVQIAIAKGELEAARATLPGVVALLEPAFAHDRNDRATLLAIGSARLRYAELHPERADARGLLEDALAAGDAQAKDSADPRLAALRTELLLALGRTQPAAALAGGLWQRGYRDVAFANLLRRHALLPANAVASTPIAAGGGP
jgi:tetratricopeptide (TPR) repeat protein